MRIQSSQEMLNYIESGHNLTLNEQGQLKTKNMVQTFFHKIADAFRSLTARGRAAIEARNASLSAAMTDMIRQDAIVNPVLDTLPDPMMGKAQRNEFIMRLSVAQATRQLPVEARNATSNYVMVVLFSEGMPGQGNSAGISQRIQDILRNIQDDNVLFHSLHCDYASTHTDLMPMLDKMSTNIRSDFMKQKGRISPDGMHDCYLIDVRRGSVRSINGQPPDASDYEGEFRELIPDVKIRGFLSMMVTQAGIEGSCAMQFAPPGNIDSPYYPGLGALLERDLNMDFSHHKYDIRVVDGMAHITMEMDAVVKTARSNPTPLGGGRYIIEMVVDINQDMTGKDIPDFTFANAHRTSIYPEV
jgi:hypothetical protein